MTTNPPLKFSALAQAIRPEAIEAEICRKSFYQFFLRAWPVMEPGEPLREGLHIRLLCDALQAVEEGRCKRLIINVPPRHTKSRIASVAFPIWLWIRKPTTKVLTASHGDELAVELAEDSRRLAESSWFVKRFPECALERGNNRKKKFKTISGGVRRAVSAGAKVTGFSGDVLVGDDIQDAESARSPEYLESTLRWWRSTFCRRLNNQDTGRIVLVMQRLAIGDLTDRLLRQKGWTHLCLPAAYEPRTYAPDVPAWQRDPRTVPGQPLWGTLESLAALRDEVADNVIWEAQYQQHPIPSGGVILDPQKFKLIKRSMLPEMFAYFMSWDTASSKNERNDATGITFWGLSREPGAEGMFLLNQWEEHLTFTELCKRVPELHAFTGQPGTIHLIEKAGPTGGSLLDALEVETTLPCIPINPAADGGKEERAWLAALYVSKGLVWVVEEDPKREQFLQKASRFPDVPMRDVVDSAIQAILYICRKFSFEQVPETEETSGFMAAQAPAAPKRVPDFFEGDDDD